MKLHPPTDPGKFFDELSVLAIKVAKTDGAPQAAANFATVSIPVSGELGDRSGTSLYGQIVSSPEYHALYQTNLRLFNLIDDMKQPRVSGECFDLTVDSINHDRWRAKAALQARFFSEAPLTEQKLGYGEAAK